MAAPVGVPVSVPVPSPLSTRLTPLGGVPLRVSAGVGEPDVVTAKLNAWPTIADAVAGLVTAGSELTTREKVWLTVPFALVAVIVNG